MPRLFTYPPHFLWAGLLLGMVLAAYAVFAWRRAGLYQQHRWATVAFGLLYLAYVPQLWVHEARLDEQGLWWTDGLWWQPQERDLRLAEVARVCTASRSSGRTLSILWRVSFKDAARSAEDVLLSEVLELNAGEIQAAMQRQGIGFRPCSSRGSP